MNTNAKSIIGKFESAQDRLVIQASDLSLETIASMVEAGAIDVRPGYQRRERWPHQQQAALIESFLLNIPVPPVYLAEEDFGTYSVIDGKQRITTIHAFMRNKLTLSPLNYFHELNGLKASELPPQLVNALRVRPYVRAVTLLKQSSPELKYEVFTRLNSGGEPLNAQEIRNVIFRGALNESIYKLSRNSFLKQQLKIKDEKSAAYREMADAEFVLRFLTLSESWNSFSGDFRFSMDKFMAANSHANESRLGDLEQRFERAISACASLWGKNAFKRPANDSWRDQMLAGMYDAEMVGVNLASDSQITKLQQHHLRVQKETKLLFKDPQFESAVRQGTNTPARVHYRINAIHKMLVALAGQ
ncbi:DUF262 domain-containing protein [Myxococcus hansupus]|uniref:DUF262 domain-containing protein n=1 Tax=Pseudomyxococcus hansupus TaxID=1297742 RepID=UPI001D0413F6|nr:DUF262 domain-containing protein [Myxococcus hansupus]